MHLAGDGAAAAHQTLHEFGASGAHQPVDPDHLARPDGERHILHQRANGAGSGETPDIQNDLARCRVRPLEQAVRIAADHLPDDPGGVGLRHGLRGHQCAVPEDRDVVADPPELVQLVRDVDDGDVVLAQVVHHREQHVDLVIGQGRRRLVHDQDLDVLQQHLADLHQLLLADRQVGDQRRRPEILPQARHHLGGPASLGGEVHEPSGDPARFAPGEHVLGDRKIREQAQFLMDDADARLLRGPRAVQLHRLPVQQNPTAGRLHRTRKDLHQRRLAGSVLTDQHVDLAPVRGERDVPQRAHAAIALADVLGEQDDILDLGWVGRRLLGRGHPLTFNSVGTTAIDVGDSSVKAPWNSSVLPVSAALSTVAMTSVLDLLFSAVPAFW